MKITKRVCLACLVVLTGVFFFVSLVSQPAIAEVTRYLRGNPADIELLGSGPVLDLGGGGADVDAAIQWMINQVRGCNDCNTKVDVAVIRSSGSAGYNTPIYNMKGVDSVETLVIPRREDADRPEVINTIRNAEVIFFAGGDQCDYTRNFQGTGIETAVESVYRRGGGIGGTSAGAMIQSDFVYNACSDTVESPEALEDPYEDVLFTRDLFQWSFLKDTLVDTHFRQRDRMGRTMTFLARPIRDGLASTLLGIAIDEGTSVVVNREGVARVMGGGAAYFIQADHLPERCEPQTPLTFSDYKIWKRRNGETFNLKNRPTQGYTLRSVQNGQINANPY